MKKGISVIIALVLALVILPAGALGAGYTQTLSIGDVVFIDSAGEEYDFRDVTLETTAATDGEVFYGQIKADVLGTVSSLTVQCDTDGFLTKIGRTLAGGSWDMLLDSGVDAEALEQFKAGIQSMLGMDAQPGLEAQPSLAEPFTDFLELIQTRIDEAEAQPDRIKYKGIALPAETRTITITDDELREQLLVPVSDKLLSDEIAGSLKSYFDYFDILFTVQQADTESTYNDTNEDDPAAVTTYDLYLKLVESIRNIRVPDGITLTVRRAELGNGDCLADVTLSSARVELYDFLYGADTGADSAAIDANTIGFAYNTQLLITPAENDGYTVLKGDSQLDIGRVDGADEVVKLTEKYETQAEGFSLNSALTYDSEGRQFTLTVDVAQDGDVIDEEFTLTESGAENNEILNVKLSDTATEAHLALRDEDSDDGSIATVNVDIEKPDTGVYRVAITGSIPEFSQPTSDETSAAAEPDSAEAEIEYSEFELQFTIKLLVGEFDEALKLPAEGSIDIANMTPQESNQLSLALMGEFMKLEGSLMQVPGYSKLMTVISQMVNDTMYGDDFPYDYSLPT